MKVVNKKIILAEDGQVLETANDGFIIQGNIYVSEVGENEKPYGGLIGDSKTGIALDEANIKCRAYTKKDFIRALHIDPDELIVIAHEMKAGYLA